jgi:hypothetical protein
MVILAAPVPGAHGVTANLVVARDRMPPGLPEERHARMHALIDLHYYEMRAKLTQCLALDRLVAPENSPPFAEIAVNWIAPQGPIGQWVCWIEPGDGSMIVATGTAGRDDLEALVPVFRSMVGTLRPLR